MLCLHSLQLSSKKSKTSNSMISELSSPVPQLRQHEEAHQNGITIQNGL